MTHTHEHYQILQHDQNQENSLFFGQLLDFVMLWDLLMYTLVRYIGKYCLWFPVKVIVTSLYSQIKQNATVKPLRTEGSQRTNQSRHTNHHCKKSEHNHLALPSLQPPSPGTNSYAVVGVYCHHTTWCSKCIGLFLVSLLLLLPSTRITLPPCCHHCCL
jgi:hypothetical protein